MFGSQVSIAATAHTYNLYTLLSAVDTTIPQNAHFVTIASDPNNGGANLYLGDANVTSTLYSNVLISGDSATYQGVFNSINLKDIYLASDTAACLVNVSTMTV
jgi:hypothetical protein